MDDDLTPLGKVCTGCGHSLPLSRFYRSRRGRYGRQSRCIECAKAAATARRLADPEGHRLAARRYYLRNRQHIREQQRAYAQQEEIRRRRRQRDAATAEVRHLAGEPHDPYDCPVCAGERSARRDN